MPSDTARELRAIKHWLRVLAFALGVGLVALANLGYVVTGYQDSLLFAATGVAGGVVALVAALSLVVDVLPETTAPGESPRSDADD